MSDLGLPNVALLRPLVTLAGWTFVMEIWMYATRIPAFKTYKINMKAPDVKKEMDTKIPQHVRQVADNFNHLHEQPTIFYAVTLALAVIGDENPYTEYALWAYVGTRVWHSIYMSIVNKVLIRFQIFVGSSLILAGITARLAVLAF